MSNFDHLKFVVYAHWLDFNGARLRIEASPPSELYTAGVVERPEPLVWDGTCCLRDSA